MDSGDIKEFFQSLIIAAVLAFLIITFVAQSFVVEGQSMEPTLSSRERLFVNKFIYRIQKPERGDIIVFSPRYDSGKKYIKRIVGLPGETIEIKEGKTFIDGQPVEEDYLNQRMFGVHEKVEVPEDHYFVMGDNRNNSTDSRDGRVGFVDMDSIDGRAFWVYWPLNEIRLVDHYDYNI